MKSITGDAKQERNDKTRAGFFAAILTDETFHDVSLQGTDGVVVGANRAALAVSSKVMKKMLFGDFKEASSNTIPLGYTGTVLKAMVEFIATGDVAFFHPHNFENLEAHDAKSIASLTDAGSCYDLPLLFDKAFNCLQRSLAVKPKMALALLESIDGEKAIILTADVMSLVVSHVLQGSSDLKDKNIIGRFGLHAMEGILMARDCPLTELSMFEILVAWASNTDFGSERKAHAKNMAKFIDLAKIHPTQLATTIAESGIVTNAELLRAYQSQATAAAKMGMTFDVPRHYDGLHFLGSGSKVFEFNKNKWHTDFFNSQPMFQGKWQWCINIIDCTSMFVGIVNQPETFSSWYLGAGLSSDASKSWGYQDCGHTSYEGKVQENFPQFKAGSKVTLSLDLTDKNKNGSLSASIDGKTPFLLFENICGTTNGDTQWQGFIPAVSVHGRCRVEIVAFEKVPN